MSSFIPYFAMSVPFARIDFMNVITTQAQLLQSENDLADSDTRIATNLVNLYRALGGGWEVADVAYGAAGAPRRAIETP
jgi:hypothetical protein